MNATKALKWSIVAQWFFVAVSIPFGLYEENFLPDSLQSFISSQAEREPTTLELVLFFISIVVLFIALYTSIAIYRLRAWARMPYTFVAIGGVVIYLFFGPVVMTPISTNFDYLSDLAIGITIGLLYFSQASENFEKTPNQ